MSIFDDNGPFSNTMMNMALFRFPSSRPPGEIAEEIGPVVCIAAVLCAAGLGGYALYDSATAEEKPPPANVYVDPSSGSAQRFEMYNRTPVAGHVVEFRALANTHDYLAELLRTSTPGDGISMNLFDSKEYLDELASRASPIVQEATQALRELQNTEQGLNTHQGGVMLTHSVLNRLEEYAKQPTRVEAERFELEAAQASLRDILFSISETQK